MLVNKVFTSNFLSMKVDLLSRFTTPVHINIAAKNNPIIKKPHRITIDKKEICIIIISRAKL